MGVRHSGRGFHIDDAGIGVSQRLDKDGLCIGADGTLKHPGLVRIYECSRHTEFRKCMRQQIVGASIDGGSRNNMVAFPGKRLKRISDGCRSAGHRQRRTAAL